jgi:hypothetical protein
MKKQKFEKDEFKNEIAFIEFQKQCIFVLLFKTTF